MDFHVCLETSFEGRTVTGLQLTFIKRMTTLSHFKHFKSYRPTWNWFGISFFWVTVYKKNMEMNQKVNIILENAVKFNFKNYLIDLNATCKKCIRDTYIFWQRVIFSIHCGWKYSYIFQVRLCFHPTSNNS